MSSVRACCCKALSAPHFSEWVDVPGHRVVSRAVGVVVHEFRASLLPRPGIGIGGQQGVPIIRIVVPKCDQVVWDAAGILPRAALLAVLVNLGLVLLGVLHLRPAGLFSSHAGIAASIPESLLLLAPPGSSRQSG